MTIKLNRMKTDNKNFAKGPAGFVLLVTMIVLVVLASLTTGLALQISMVKRRQQYMIEYQRARYGLDSAMKYILSELPTRNFPLTEREENPDFSDVYWMNKEEFAEFIAEWAENATDEQIQAVLKRGASLTQPAPLSSGNMVSGLLSLFGVGGGTIDANTVSTDARDTDEETYIIELDPNDVIVPGPYGAPWPLVTEPIDLEIGPCDITILIEDENAKMPLSWLVTDSQEANKQAQNALKTFCEWMSWDQQQLRELEEKVTESMDQIHEKKAFKLNPGPILIKSTTSRRVRTPGRTTSRSRRRVSRRTASVRSAATKERPAVAHTTDFAKLFHSSLLDREFLAQPLPDTADRIESPLKYLSLWGAQRVNVNTAPRHVLEAAFALSMDSFDIPEFTQEVINLRKEKPFKNINELKEVRPLDSDTVKKFNDYLTTTSTFFKVSVISHSGNASSSAVATVVKEGKNVQRLAILYE
jgi:type II secretory pathway pseudopilin PulG